MDNFSNKRYYSLDNFFKEKFNSKVVKLSLDGGFSCPNRDKYNKNGCIFCSNKGSGEYTGFNLKKDNSKVIKDLEILNKYYRNKFSYEKKEIEDKIKLLNLEYQVKSQIEIYEKKYKNKNLKYVLYFQNYTNTYETPEYLDYLLEKSLSLNIISKKVVGVFIGTRGDSINSSILKVLEKFNKKTFLVVELGLQTVNEKSREFLNIGYNMEIFDETLNRLTESKIKTMVHCILNLPYDENYMDTYNYINSKKIWGVKIGVLNILKNTKLFEIYMNENNIFKSITADEYINIVINILENLRKDIVINRLTGDGKKDEVIYPKWIFNKRYILNGIDKQLKLMDTFQGKKRETL